MVMATTQATPRARTEKFYLAAACRNGT